jgi:hypothetical protein
MRRKVLVSLLCSLLLTLAGCGKRAATQSITNTNRESGLGKFYVCGLIESKISKSKALAQKALKRF